MMVSWMPGVVSSTTVTIGRRWLVHHHVPRPRGHRCRLHTRDASTHMYSRGSYALKAQKSTTWVPWVLISLRL